MHMNMTNNMVTMKVNIFEAKARLSELVDAVEAGTPVTICRRNRPIAQLVRVAAAPVAERPVGGARGAFTVPPAFFDPLPDSMIDTFYPPLDATTGLPAVAEGTAPARPKPAPRRRGGRS